MVRGRSHVRLSVRFGKNAGVSSANDPPPEQLALIREMVAEAKAKAPKAKPRTWRGAAVAEELPVARVLVNKGVLHLDRLFDYAVPAELSESAQPGVRVRVRFGAGSHRVHGGRREGGGLIDGFIVERRAESDYNGALAALAQVVSPEVVLGPRMLALARAVADRYAGSLADVLQLALPPRNARAEAKPSPEPLPPPAAPEPGGWQRYGSGPAFLRALSTGAAPRAVWTALPGPGWAEELARAIAATLASGRGALAVVPDGRTAARLDTALTALLGEGRHALLTAESGPEKRYREWLAVSRGSVRAVVGTRAAMFAPVRDLGLVAVWDDGDSSHSDDRAPFPHVREVLELRAVTDGCGFLAGSTSCTVEAAQLVESGWARPLVADRETVRQYARGSGRWATNCWPATGRPGPRACRAWRGRPYGRGSRPGRCWSRCRGGATCPGWRVSGAVRRPAARSAPGRWRPPTSGTSSAAGAGGPSRPGTARSAGRSGCAPRWSARGGRPRNWGGPSRPCPYGRPGATTSWTRCRTGRRWWCAPPGRSRSRRAPGTRRRCCSTAGPC